MMSRALLGRLRQLGAVAVPMALGGTLMGCVVPPPAPLVSLPGAGKTFEAFQVDDLACRTAIGQVPIVAAPGATAAPVVTAPVVAPADPALAYLQCMASRGNVIAPLPTAYAAAYPGYDYVYSGFGDYYPWLYADRVAFFSFGFGGFYGHRFYGNHFYGPRWGGPGRGDFARGGFGRGGFERGGGFSGGRFGGGRGRG